MDKDLLCLLLFFLQISFFLTRANMLFFPALGANWVAPGLDNHTLEGLDSLAHLRVELLLHRVDMVGHILTEAGHKGEWLLDCLWGGHMQV